jgi:hypothetical protein
VAAVTMPLWFAIAAVLLGDRLGYTAVAWAWVIGYPIAFWVLLRFALRHLEIGAGRYAAAMLRLASWTGLAIAAGAGARALVAGVELPVVRALAAAGAAMATFVTLLVVAEGITPRSLSAALKPPPRDAEPAIE